MFSGLEKTNLSISFRLAMAGTIAAFAQVENQDNGAMPEPGPEGDRMLAFKKVMFNRSVWIVIMVALAFVAYHAPRIANAIPLF
jgi:hypothetical protein